MDPLSGKLKYTMDIASVIKAVMQKQRISIKELTDKMHRCETTVRKMLKGWDESVHFYNMMLAANALGMVWTTPRLVKPEHLEEIENEITNIIEETK